MFHRNYKEKCSGVVNIVGILFKILGLQLSVVLSYSRSTFLCPQNFLMFDSL